MVSQRTAVTSSRPSALAPGTVPGGQPDGAAGCEGVAACWTLLGPVGLEPRWVPGRKTSSSMHLALHSVGGLGSDETQGCVTAKQGTEPSDSAGGPVTSRRAVLAEKGSVSGDECVRGGRRRRCFHHEVQCAKARTREKC